MKDEPIRYLGLDVHRSTVVASVRDEQGKAVMKATVATEEKAIVALVKSAGPRVHVAFEEGPQAQWLHDLLLGHAERVVVCPASTRTAGSRLLETAGIGLRFVMDDGGRRPPTAVLLTLTFVLFLGRW